MTVEISYSQARKQLAALLDEVTQDKEIVIINRRGRESAALIAADELASLTEAVHLLRSPANAERLLRALSRAIKEKGELMEVDELMDRVELSE
jgi:antitoxin YefM